MTGDPKELNITCPTCEQHAARRRNVYTEVGRVTVTECVICDRAKCPGCNKSLPGNAMTCALCGSYVWYRPGEGAARPVRTLEMAESRARSMAQLVADLEEVKHPELLMARVDLVQALQEVAHLRAQA